MPRLNAEVRFWESVVFEPMSGCWLWTGYTTRGYGRMIVNKKITQAHRFSYELHKGSIPSGLVLDHLCRNRCCVNPDHLEIVTNRENLLRGFGPTGTNARKTHCVNGHLYTPENTGRSRTNRRCIQCAKEQFKKRYWSNPLMRERNKQNCKAYRERKAANE